MLADVDADSGKLLVGDLVFCDDALDGVKTLIVHEEVHLDNISEHIVVRQVARKDSEYVLSSKLLMDNGLIFIIPSQMYDIINNEIQLNDVASQMLEDCIINKQSGNLPYSDEEAAELAEISIDGGENSQNEGQFNPIESGEQLQPCIDEDEDEDESVGTTLRKRMRLMIGSDDEDDGDVLADDGDAEVVDAVGHWVIAKFSFTKRDNYYLGQITQVIDDNLMEFQFYRVFMSALHVFQKITPRETHNKSVIVEWLPRSAIDIICGSKVKIMGIDLNYKCV